MNTETNRGVDAAGILNAFVQALAITSYYYIGAIWPMYVVMGMFVLLGFIQTVAGAGVLSNLVEYNKENSRDAQSFHILIGFMYCASAYQIYIMGFVFFSGFAFAHAIFYTFTILFKRLKT